MTFEEATAFLDARIQHGIRPGTERIEALVEALDHPERTYPSIHVTGTNGKYSVAMMTTAILTELGLTVGTYTSPHVEDLTERFTVGGTPIERGRFADVVEYLLPYVELVEGSRDDHLTYFELLTAVALEWFFDLPVHAAVVEVGLGGEYDATNVVDAPVGVITKVARDHLPQFGDDVMRTAWEKAGIAKPGQALLSGVDQPELARVVAERAAERNVARLAVYGEDFELQERLMAVGGQQLRVRGLFGTYRELFMPLFGEHQARNAAFAVAAAEAFAGEALDPEGVVAGLGRVSLPGRLEVVGRRPLVVVDGGHNPDAAQAVMRTVTEELSFQRLVVVVGMLDDKLVEEVLAILARSADRLIVTAPEADRAAGAERLYRGLAALEVAETRLARRETVAEAMEAALAEAGDEDLVLVFGSFYTAGEARAWMRTRG